MNSTAMLSAVESNEISQPVRDATTAALNEVNRAFMLVDEVERRLERNLSPSAPTNAAGKSVKEAPRCEAHSAALGVAEAATGLCDRLIQLRERIVT